ncbi:MAG: PEP-CTERM sorting domain-containing protein [Terriglobales bacterium]
MKSTKGMYIALIAAVLLLPIAAHADSFTLYCTGGNNCSTTQPSSGNYYTVSSVETVTGTTSGTWSDNITFSFTGTGNGGYFQGFSLTLFPQNDTMTISNTSTVPSGYNYVEGKFNNGNNGCNTNFSGAICVYPTVGSEQLLGTLAFDFSGTYSGGAALTTVDLLANATTCQTGSKCGNTLAISQDITGNTNTPTPEPGSMTLLAAGLAGLVTLFRRRGAR